jgi:hypothetical protein
MVVESEQEVPAQSSKRGARTGTADEGEPAERSERGDELLIDQRFPGEKDKARGRRAYVPRRVLFWFLDGGTRGTAERGRV